MKNEAEKLNNQGGNGVLPCVSTRFLCDCCGKEKHNKEKHLMYDENWNIQEGLNMCEDCYREGLGVE